MNQFPTRLMVVLLALISIGFPSGSESLAADSAVPALPESNGAVTIAAQPWPHQPGPRTIKVTIHYPGGKLSNVNAQTGTMLTLHNWGGTGCAGTASPTSLAKELNVVAICVDYLQSGKESITLENGPYDFGYLQGLDALRALYFVQQGLKSKKIPFAEGRTYCTGGSGGGNVTLMAHKLAPRTFACVIDMCGMPKLSDDIAFNLPGGTGLNAGYSQDPSHDRFLSKDAQQIRFIGDPAHLKTTKQLGGATKVIVVHGSGDRTCPFADAQEMVKNMTAAGLDLDVHFLKQADLDGKIFTSIGHALGNRTLIVFRVADKYLRPESPEHRTRSGKSDFELRDEKVQYETPNGRYVISYNQGYPVGRFEAKQK